MYCRNCANQVDEKAMGCPKCGMDPKKAKSYCPGCGNATNAEQVLCTSCGVSLASKGITLDVESLKKFDAAKFFGNKGHIAAVVALVGCFFPWIRHELLGGGVLLTNMFGLDGFDVGPWAWLTSFFPLLLIGFLVADHVASLTKYKKWFANGATGFIVTFGIFLHQSVWGMDSNVAWGFYLVAIATITVFMQVRRS